MSKKKKVYARICHFCFATYTLCKRILVGRRLASHLHVLRLESSIKIASVDMGCNNPLLFYVYMENIHELEYFIMNKKKLRLRQFGRGGMKLLQFE